jgi:hypothetical protein
MSGIESKCEEIRSVVAHLEAALGPAIAIADNWTEDAAAIGISSASLSGRLAYISTDVRAPCFAWVSIELPPAPGSDLPYSGGPSFDVGSLDELTDRLREHLLPPGRAA